ncbi:MAG: hypothetical protein AAGG50_06035 [Bacteroidota bacterium]
METPPNYWDHPDWWDEGSADTSGVAFVAERRLGDVLRDTWAFFRANGVEFGLGLIVLAAPVVFANVLVTLAAGTTHGTVAALTNVALSGFVRFAAWEAGAGVLWLAQHALSLAALAVLVAATFAYLSRYTQGHAGGITPDVLWQDTRPLLAPVGATFLVFGAALLGLHTLARLPMVGGLVWLGGLFALTAVGSLWTVAMAYETDHLPDGLRRVSALLGGRAGPGAMRERLRPTLGIVAMALLVGVVVQPVAFVLGVVARMGDAVGGVLGGTVLVAVEVLGLALLPVVALPTVAATFVYGHLLALEQRDAAPPPSFPAGDGATGASEAAPSPAAWS